MSDRRFNLVPFDQITLPTGRDYLVKGLLPQTGLAVAWGPPQSGKSFWAFDVAMHVALGFSYRGRRVQGGSVVYIAGEGQHGFRKRVAAFQREKMLPSDHADFYLIGEPLDLVGEREALIAAVRRSQPQISPALIVLDTLNRTLRGDENSPEDMARYVAAADNLRDAFGCCVLIVHHCGIEGTRPRGHTSLTGAADAQFAVSQAGDIRTVKVEKQKDGPTGDNLSFTLREVELGEDDDGDPLTSCVVEASEEPSAGDIGPRLTANQRTLLNILDDAGPAGLSKTEWNDAGRDAGIGTKRKADLTDARLALKNKSLVHECGGRWYVTRR